MLQSLPIINIDPVRDHRGQMISEVYYKYEKVTII